MRIASFTHAGRPSYGAIVADGIIDLGKRLSHPTLRAALAADAMAELQRAARTQAVDYRLADVKMLTPVPNADKIICVGRNYKGHVAESNQKLPEFPSLFIRLHNSVVAHDAAIVRPHVSGDYDYEGELALVIGKPGRYISRADALSHVAGYTCFNDGSIRDYQFKHSLTAGKNFFATGSIGPFLVTADEIPDPSQLDLATRLNAVQVQHTRTDDLIFDVPTIIAYVSSFTELVAGDIIATGTPEGVGFARTPPLWMKAGDVLEVEISGIGVLRNHVVDEAG